MRKRMISMLLAIAMVLCAMPVAAAGKTTVVDGSTVSHQAPTVATQSCTSGFSTDYILTGDGATDIVAIALAQEGRTGSELGYTEEWCADFVSDCAILAGQSDAVPQYGAVSGLYDRILSAGGTNTTDSPRPGDICFINWNGGTSMGHVEIVYEVSDDSVYTIGGNSGSADSLSSRWVKKHAPLSSQYILSILRPNYICEGYTVTYDANGGTGAPDAQTKAPTTDLILSSVEPTYDGHRFLGWSLSSDAMDVDYAPGDTYDQDKSITLYAVWGSEFCGDDMTWTVEDGVLTISGTGQMHSWTDTVSPWYPIRGSICSVYIADGVTDIGSSAFYRCTSLTGITLPDSVTVIGDRSFYDCTALTDVLFCGTEEQWAAVTIGTDNEALINSVIQCHTHDYTATVVDPTCTEQGCTTYTCSECGHTSTQTADPLGHDYQGGICSICGKIQLSSPQISSCYSTQQTSVKVTWTTVENADGYELWRSATPDDQSSWTRTKTVNDGAANCYTNQGLAVGVTYYYSVRAFLIDGNGEKVFSEWSNTAYMPAAVIFDGPYSNATDRIRLLWQQVQGANGYQIWRQNADGSYSVIKTLGDKGNVLTDDQGATTAYSNSELAAGQDYIYKIRAFTITEDGRKIFGAYSDEITVAVMPEAPVIAVTAPKAGRAQLDWDPISGAEGYQIWISDGENGEYHIVKSILSGDTASATIYDLVSGETCWFKIRAYVEIDSKKTFGGYSETVSITIQ